MAGTDSTRDAVGVCLTDSNFAAVAARLTGALLRQAIAKRLAACGINVVVIAASGLDDCIPHREAEVIWQMPEGGDFERQTIRWDLPSWSFGDDAAVVATQRHATADGDARLGGLRALRLTSLGRA